MLLFALLLDGATAATAEPSRARAGRVEERDNNVHLNFYYNQSHNHIFMLFICTSRFPIPFSTLFLFVVVAVYVDAAADDDDDLHTLCDLFRISSSVSQ